MAAERSGEAGRAAVEGTAAPRDRRRGRAVIRNRQSVSELPEALAVDLDGSFERLVRDSKVGPAEATVAWLARERERLAG